MIKAVIFDCFGVLINEWIVALVDEHIPSDPGVDIKVWDIIKASNVGMIDPKDVGQQIADALGISKDELATYQKTNEVKNHRLVNYIYELRKKGIKTAVLSNVSSGGIKRRFSSQEIAELFDVVVESGSLGYAKPDRESYIHTLSLLNLEPQECVMIDDKEDYCAGAELVGMGSVLYTNFDQFKKDLTEAMNRD